MEHNPRKAFSVFLLLFLIPLHAAASTAVKITNTLSTAKTVYIIGTNAQDQKITCLTKLIPPNAAINATITTCTDHEGKTITGNLNLTVSLETAQTNNNNESAPIAVETTGNECRIISDTKIEC